ncbi:lipase family protein [Clavibacter michiganensis subsp. phaseoli]|uniref:alpha/beta fold hydrolase n=1 Tax=Clavibacter phaseoli TaxID=1734031 RepID=UPI001FB314DB|nr:alpha/beta fold hydrolase [Clavibacter phaseoli]MCJ1709633.1 lipase family protein [Clavibacter phaseoli]
MANEPVLLFLHGVGDGDRKDTWRANLTQGLAQLGYPDLEDVTVIAPKYAHALRGWDQKVALPGLTVKQPVREAARTNRREFEQRMGAIEFRLGRDDAGPGIPFAEAAFDAALRSTRFEQARNYATDPQVRAQVLDLILARVPSAGEIVVVGHSLGSVIAADVVRRLPPAVRVAGLITIGSPLAHGSINVDKLRDALQEPPTNLAWWVNFWNFGDPVSAHRGLSSVFPWMVDFRIETRQIGIPAHSAAAYLTHEAVATAIGFALFGSLSQELARVERGVDIPLDESESLTLLALRYGHLTVQHLDGSQRERFVGALRLVQAAAVAQIARRNKAEGRLLPSAVARLAFDVTDADAVAPEPLPSRHLSKEEAVVVMTVLATENVIRPFEIVVSKETRQRAMEDLTAEMGLTSRYGTDVFAAAKEAQDILTAARNVNWLKWGAVGAGAAAIVVATGGLALAVGAAGYAGAAALTTALAAFGPGGMIGGLLTAGSLVSAGGGGIAFGLASSATAAETVESVVQTRLAATILRKRQGLEPDRAVWDILAQTEIAIRREHERLDEFSDEGSPALKELKRKIITIERAMTYLSENGMEPEVPEDASDVPR